MELKHHLIILKRWGWILLLCVAEAALFSYWFASRQPNVYQSISRYMVGSALERPDVTTNDLRAASQIGQTYAEIATSRPIMETVIARLQLDADPDDLAASITAKWNDGSQVLTVRARASTPDTAAAVANAVGEVLIERSPSGPTSLQATRRSEATAYIEQLRESIRGSDVAIAGLVSRIQQTTDQVAQRSLIVQLDQERRQLGISQDQLAAQYAILQGGSSNQITVVESALPDAVPFSPNVKETVVAAIVVGIVLGLIVMLLLEFLVDVVYTPDELRRVTGLTYLGGIPRYKKLRGSRGTQLIVQAEPAARAAESYRILNVNLQRVGGAEQMASLLVTSPSPGDGKSEIAANLAMSVAQSGKRVILIDADLRQPRLTSIFGLEDEDGLSNLLTQDEPLRTIPIEANPLLEVLPAGRLAANPSEVLGSSRMLELIQMYKATADAVIIDGPPLLFSDAVTLALHADSVLLVASSGKTEREITATSIEHLRLVGANLVGTVLNRVKSRSADSYYSTAMTKRSLLKKRSEHRITLGR